MKRNVIVAVLMLASLTLYSQTKYKLPPKEVVDILDASPTPLVLVSPRTDALLLVEYRAHPPIALLARPFLRLAGVRIDPELNARQRLTQYTGISVKWIESGTTVRIDLPASVRIGVPRWSNDGKRLAFTRDVGNGVELWIADAMSGKARAIPGVRVNDVLGVPFDWTKDNVNLLARLVPSGERKTPEQPKVPIGPVVEESSGKISRVPTYQDLLKDPFDEKLFEFYSTSQLALVNAQTGEVKTISDPSIISSASFSPDEQHLLVTRLKSPFSYRVPYNLFARTTEVWDQRGNVVATISDLGISDEVPSQGVPTGPRSVDWQTLHDSKLVWVEALDGGDPMKKAPFRDDVMTFDAPFKGSPTEVMKVQHRYSGFEWTANRDKAILAETDRDRRWRTSSLVDFAKPTAARKVLFDLSTNDAYNDPGRPVYATREDGQRVMVQDGDWIYLSGNGSSAQGDRPFLDKFNLATLKKERLHWSGEKSLERFTAFVKM
ncbi:MAG: WD40-like beta propeller repeat protein,prolyl oligopeptidase family protein, partial [Bacteroidetes bacterium]|nr:WD40-like beta propeller repeat protein,prolyl oligopeptidase family protein [Bacteroidota bacterium]